MPKCKYCGEEYYDTHTCWTAYCMEYLHRNCEQCMNKCKGYYNAQTTTTSIPISNSSVEAKHEGKLEISESQPPAGKKEGRLEITETQK